MVRLREEVGYTMRKLLWDEVPRSDASGHRIVLVKWVDTEVNQKFFADS